MKQKDVINKNIKLLCYNKYFDMNLFKNKIVNDLLLKSINKFLLQRLFTILQLFKV